MKNIFLTVTCFILSLGLSAQAFKGLKLVEKHDYEAAISAFNNDLKTDKNQALALYGLAKVYSSPNNPNFEVDMAYAYHIKAYEAFRKTGYKEKSKISKTLNSSIIKKQKKQITQLAYTRAEESNSVEDWNYFLNNFEKPGYKLLRQAETSRNNLAYNAIKNSTDWKDWGAFTTDYYTALKTRTPKLYKIADSLLFLHYFEEHSFDQYSDFETSYPKSKFVRDSSYHHLNRAIESEDVDGLFAIATNTHHPAFTDYIVEKGKPLVESKGDQLQTIFFIENYCGGENCDALYRRLYKLHKAQTPSLVSTINFQNKYPDFPDQSELNSDIHTLKEQTFTSLIEDGSKRAIEAFLNRFPNHPKKEQLIGKIADISLNEFSSIDAYKRFKQLYPEYSKMAEIDATIKEKQAQLDKEEAEQMINIGSAYAIRQFIKKYPEHSQIDRLWKTYAAKKLSSDPSLYELKRFKENNEDYPFMSEIDNLVNIQTKKEEDKALAELQNDNGINSDYYAFFEKYPDNPNNAKLEKQLSDKLIAEKDYRELERLLEKRPNIKSKKMIVDQLYKEYEERGDRSKLASIAEEHPTIISKQKLDKTLESMPISDADVSFYTPAKASLFKEYITEYKGDDKAFKAFKKVIKKDLGDRNWDRVEKKIDDYESHFKSNKDFKQLRLQLGEARKVNAQSISNLVNTNDNEEYASTISADGKNLYFCRNTGAMFSANEDIYLSTLQADGQWSEPSPISELNSESGNEATESISVDGNEMILFDNGTLCTSQKGENGWSKPIPLPKTVNKESWQADARISADGKVLLFSRRSISYGQTDIYASFRDADGSWGESFSLGKTINTTNDERSPFIHPDMKTMYFSSERAGGFGKLDIYVTKRLDDSWTNWSEPINLGPGINTDDHDWGFKVTTDGKQAYFSVEGSSSSDIFICNLPKGVQPETVSTVTGRLTDINGKPLNATIVWQNLISGDVVQETKSDPKTGDFFATLPDEGQYSYSVKKDGYFPLSGKLKLDEDQNLVLEEDMVIATIEEMKEKNITLPLNNLYFDTGSSTIQSTSHPELDRLAEWLLEYHLNIEIQGHTDNVGSDENNQNLSQNRALAVEKYLMSKGVSEDMLSAKGFGETKPMADNNTAQGRAQNRRVEIMIVE